VSPNSSDRRGPEETRARILEVAWDLFRQLGARTTIADVADKLGMSSANIYRFYASRQALCEAICAGQLGAMTARAREIAGAERSASARIREILVMLHHAMRDQMLNESRVHEIVDIAIRENWPSIDVFQTDCAVIVAELVAQGQARGEFAAGDPFRLAAHTLCACVAIQHPNLIAHKMEASLALPPEAVADFALRALAHPEPFPSSEGA
jgi:AcrR family transcriptional regulator